MSANMIKSVRLVFEFPCLSIPVHGRAPGKISNATNAIRKSATTPSCHEAMRKAYCEYKLQRAMLCARTITKEVNLSERFPADRKGVVGTCGLVS